MATLESPGATEKAAGHQSTSSDETTPDPVITSDAATGGDTEPPQGREHILHRPPEAKIYAIGGGGCLLTQADRPGQLLKVPHPYDEHEARFEVERRVFERLGEHPNIVRVVGTDEYGIWLERAAHGCLRLMYRGSKDGDIEQIEAGYASVSIREKLEWCRDVARAEQHLHDNNVRHADLSGRNLLVDADRRVLLCDFGGSSIDDEPALVAGEEAYRHPSEEEWKLPTIRNELHCVGSTFYELVTGNQPHDPLEGWAAKQLMEEGKYPDTDGVLLGYVISKCWKGEFSKAEDVAVAVEAEMESRGITLETGV